MNAEWFSKQYGQVVSARDFSFNPLDFFACEGPQPWTYEEQADVARLLQQPGLAPPASYRRRVAKRLIAHLEALGLEEVHDGLYASVIPGADEDADDWMAKPTRVIYTTDGLELRVEETRGLISAGGTTGLQTWPAALLLGEWILHAQLEAPGTVWELGCGTGLCSALVSKVYPGCRVYATDASGLACACARTTAESNGLGNMHVSEYEWGHELPELPLPDWVIGADIVSRMGARLLTRGDVRRTGMRRPGGCVQGDS